MGAQRWELILRRAGCAWSHKSTLRTHLIISDYLILSTREGEKQKINGFSFWSSDGLVIKSVTE